MAADYKFELVTKVLNLIDERDRLKAKVKAYEHQTAQAPDFVEQEVYKYGVRKTMEHVKDHLRYCYRADVVVTDGKAEEYEEWAQRQQKEGSFRVPEFLSVDMFVTYFESELREEFAERKKKALDALEGEDA